MLNYTLLELLPVLQNAIGPVIIISGISLFLLVTTNRLGRVIDRVRDLATKQYDEDDNKVSKIKLQLGILWTRARILRITIIFASIGLLASALMIIVLFIGSISAINLSQTIVLLFVICLFCLILAILLLIYDINKSLEALKLEMVYCKILEFKG